MAGEIYFVQSNLGRSQPFLETDPDNNSRVQIVNDIVSGEIEKPIQILECEVGGLCRDVTEDIALEVREIIANNDEGLPPHLIDFIEHTLGIRAASRLRRLAAA